MNNLTVTIIQTDLHWENKKANLEMLQQKIESIKEKTEVIILPGDVQYGIQHETQNTCRENGWCNC